MSIFVIFVVVLFVLAIGDLIVGVSNDAVNFLNSAIGSRVASRRLILIVASVGIVFGATFSNGLMEVARKGIFNPDLFTFTEVMVLFAAVMFTDIILLDLFNSLSLPTSTTVSIVFELLGAALALGAYQTLASGGSIADAVNFINADSAIVIISGIFLSVGIAFIVGAVVQFISRLLFTFNYKKNMSTVGVIWAATALTALCEFLLLKGLKGASFASPEVLGWIDQAGLLLIAGLFGFWLITMAIAQRLGVRILRFVVLVGTFSLAFAFAGNDLVNFVGVPIAGLDSYLAWSASGVDADSYMMDSLLRPVATDSWILIVAGLIMAIYWHVASSAPGPRSAVSCG